MIEKLNQIIKKHDELSRKLIDPTIVNDRKLYQQLSQEYSNLKEKANIAKTYINKINEIKEVEELIFKEDDNEMKDLANNESNDLKSELDNLKSSINKILIESDPDDKKNIILEIRSGTGGIEAALFAEDLFRMYSRYAESKNWEIELMTFNQNDGGGIKEAIFLLKGQLYLQLKLLFDSKSDGLV